MKKFWLITLLVVILLVFAFFITSFVLAQVHDVNMIEEWQSWATSIENWLGSMNQTEETTTALISMRKQVNYEILTGGTTK